MERSTSNQSSDSFYLDQQSNMFEWDTQSQTYKCYEDCSTDLNPPPAPTTQEFPNTGLFVTTGQMSPTQNENHDFMMLEDLSNSSEELNPLVAQKVQTAAQPIQAAPQPVQVEPKKFSKTNQKVFSAKIKEYLQDASGHTVSSKVLLGFFKTLMSEEYFAKHDPHTLSRCLRTCLTPSLANGTLKELKSYNGVKGKFYQLIVNDQTAYLNKVLRELAEMTAERDFYRTQCENLFGASFLA